MKVVTTNEHDKRTEALDRALKQIEKAYGKGAIMQLDQMESDVEGISTGALSLDLALGGRGLPRGRIIEVFGPESSGKTTLALHVAAAAQRIGGIAAIVDAEHALNAQWARKCGVNLERLLVSQPDSGEEALEITEMLIRSGSVEVIIVDSVAALIPRSEIEGQMGDAQVGTQARLMSQAMRKLTSAIGRTKTIVIFINQIRMKIGVMFGSPETTPGGRALKFYSSVRLDIRRIGSIKDGETVTGSRIRVKVVKNKVAAPFRETELDIMFDGGISMEGDLLDLALQEHIVDKAGAWFSYKDIRLGQGRENAKQFLVDNADLASELTAAVIKKRAPGSPATTPESLDAQSATPAGSGKKGPQKTSSDRRKRA